MMMTSGITMAEISISIENKYFGGEQHKVITLKTTIPRYNFMLFYVFKMAVAIAFLRENAVEAI